MSKSPVRPFKRILLFAYTAIMLLLLFKRTPGSSGIYLEELLQRINLTPLSTVCAYLRSFLHGSLIQKRLAIVNLVGNVIMFIPFGLLLPELFSGFRPFFRYFVKCLVLICLVEILQLVSLLGVLDIDDVILNMVGFSLGYGFYKTLPQGEKTNEQR